MKITWIANKDRPDLMTIHIDGEPWRDIHTRIFGKRPTLPTNWGSLDEFETSFCDAEYQGAKVYAFKRLAAKSHLTRELHKKLLECLVSEKNIEHVLLDLKRLGYLNDESWIESFIQYCLRRHIGPRVILVKLLTKGFSKEEASQAIQKFSNEAGQYEHIIHLLQTRYSKYDLSDFHSRHKVTGALLRKGFSISEIQEALKR